MTEDNVTAIIAMFLFVILMLGIVSCNQHADSVNAMTKCMQVK